VSQASQDYTTKPDGLQDVPPVDIGFHHRAQAEAPATSVTASQFSGCAANVNLFPSNAAGNLGSGHLVVVDNLSGPGGTLSSLTTLDPRGTTTSRLAREDGRGWYRLAITGAVTGTYSMDVYVDGGAALPATINCP